MSEHSLFYVDSCGDKNNLLYESLYKADIPEYTKQGTWFQLDPSTGEVASRTLDNSTSYRFYDAKIQRQLRKQTAVRVFKDSCTTGVFQQFEPLSKDTQDGICNCTFRYPFKAWRVGKIQETLVSRTTRLNAELDKDPCNEHLWLQLLDLQDLYYDCGLLSKKNLLEKKCSILVKALEKIPNSEVLLLRYIGIMVGVCDNKTMLDLFARASQRSPKSLKLHILRMRFVLSSVDSFSLYTMENICRDAFECLSCNNFVHGLYFLILFARILFQSGWNQKALGIFQAIVEFSCFRVNNLDDFPVDLHRIRKFGERNLFFLFWKSFSCRIGEKPRHNWTDWLVTFLRTIEKHYDQIGELEEDNEKDMSDESSVSSREELNSPAKLPSVEEEGEQEWMESGSSSSFVSEASSIDDKPEDEIEIMLTSHPVGKELKNWLLEEKSEMSKLNLQSFSIEYILQHEDDSLRNLFGNTAENICLPRDIAHFIPQDCNIDSGFCYHMLVELLYSLRGWPFLDSVTTLIPCDLQNIQLKEETLSNSFSLSKPRDIELALYDMEMSLFHQLDKTWPHFRDILRFVGDWLLGSGYGYIMENSNLKENVPFTFVSNIYDSILFSKASIFHSSHLDEGDPCSLRIAEAFIFFQGIVGGFPKGKSVAKRLLKTCESFSLYTVFAELLLHLDMVEESNSIYNTCLGRLNDSTWREIDCCRPVLSFLFYLLNHVEQDWRTKKRVCQNVFRVFIGKFGSNDDALSLTETMMIKNKLQKLAMERFSLGWGTAEEMQHFSVFACQLVFEWLLSGLDRAREVLIGIENEMSLTSQRNEWNESVYVLVLMKLRQLLCLFSFLDWLYFGDSRVRNIRSNVEEALEKYPGNDLLLFMYSVLFRLYGSHSMESSFHVLFSRLLYKPNASAVTVIAQIVAQGGSLEAETSPSVRYKTKSLLTRSLHEANLACSSFLWQRYLQLLHVEQETSGEFDPSLKKAFYRAFTHIPYSKELILKALEFLSDNLSIREAKDIWSIAREKGILFTKTFPYEGD